MGLTHSIILSGLLGHDHTMFTIVDPNFSSRIIAKLLFPNAKICGLSGFKNILKNEHFNYSLITTPPNARIEFINKIINVSDSLFIEKPVLTKLSENQMSGYVLQHAPLNNIMNDILEDSNLIHIQGSLITNIDFFSVKNGWRSGRYGSVLHEFGGHVLSVIGACALKYNLFKNSITDLQIVGKYNDRNSVELFFSSNNIKISISLLASSRDVRKASYNFTFTTEKDVINYDLYSIKSKNNNFEAITLPNNRTSTPYYVRGFEFTEQMERLISNKLDVLSTEQIFNFENILNKFEEISENNTRR